MIAKGRSAFRRCGPPG